MVLLTSSQVGVAISSFIIFLCTSALFLSGYVLQQKTVSDIRAAIKPQLDPLKAEAYLPPKFRESELWNGKNGEIIDVETGHIPLDKTSNDGKNTENMVGATRWQKAAKLKEEERLKQETDQNALVQEKYRTKTQQKKKGEGAPKVEKKELSRAARRKKIKDEALAAGEGEGFKGYRRRMW